MDGDGGYGGRVLKNERRSGRSAAEESVRHIARRLGGAVDDFARDQAQQPTRTQPLRAAVRSGRGGEVGRCGVSVPRQRRSGAVSGLPPKLGKLAGCKRLRREVQTRLDQQHSRSRSRCGCGWTSRRSGDVGVDETIYESIYLQGRGQLRRELHRCCVPGGPCVDLNDGWHNAEGASGHGHISERPAEIATVRCRAWEGDLIVGADRNRPRDPGRAHHAFVMLLHLPDGHGALAVQNAVVDKMTQLPDHLRGSLTWDQGKEMSNHLAIAEDAALDIYFCDPHSAWQRGSNENTNGLLRQYFAKGTDCQRFRPTISTSSPQTQHTTPQDTGLENTSRSARRTTSQPFKPPGVVTTA